MGDLETERKENGCFRDENIGYYTVHPGGTASGDAASAAGVEKKTGTINDTKTEESP